MSDIAIQATATDPGSRSLQVTVPVDRVLAAESKAVKYWQSRVRLPGFRAGKAPVAVVRKRYQDAIRQAVLEELIRESWEAARAQESLTPLTDPSIRNLKFEPGAPLEFELLVEVKPEIALGRTGGFSLTRPAPVVTDAMVQEQLDRLREQKATWLPVEGERPVAGQLVRVDVTPLDEEGAEPQPHTFILGEGRAIPSLEEAVMALRPGEVAEPDVRFPDDHPDPARRGQPRKLRLALHEVKRQELPAADDAFAAEMGDFESLDALRAAIRVDLEREAAREADARLRDQLVQQLVEANGIPAPHGLVHRVLHAYAQAWEIPQERHDEFEREFHPMAEAQVKRDLLLDAVVEAQGLAATEAEIDERVSRIAESSKRPAGEVYASLQKSGRLRELERAITEDKAFTWLLGQSTIAEASA
jgi:trigger factor